MRNIHQFNMQSRSRGENWTSEEKEILINLMKYSIRNIELRKTDTTSNRRKHAEWCKVRNKFEQLTGKSRDVAQLKGFWRRSRMLAKKRIIQHKRALHANGGEIPPPPSEEDLQIVKMCSPTFGVEENDLESDDVFFDNVAENVHNKDKVIVASDCSADPLINTHNAAVPSQQEDRDEPQGGETSFHVEIIHGNDPNYTEVNTERAGSTLMLDRGSCKVEEESATDEEVNFISNAIGQEKSIDSPRNRSKTGKSRRALIGSQIKTKAKIHRLLEEEYELKLRYHRQELFQQKLRHKLELDILLLEKEKKEWELKKLLRK